MLKLKNIKKNNDIISAEYEPENSGVVGRIEIDMSSGKVIKSVVSEYDKELPVYINHAINGLKKLSSAKELPSEKTIMWY